MNFLEAHRIVSRFSGGSPLHFTLGMSGASDTLNIFLKAEGATLERSVEVETFSFNTLGQTLLSEPEPHEREVFVLFPWDLVPEADWRSGVPRQGLDEGGVTARAQDIARLVARRSHAACLYVPAPIPPLFPDPATTQRLAAILTGLACSIGADLLSESTFSLGSYLANGSPFASASLGMVAKAIIAKAAALPHEASKVLVTDLDNVMWSGVIGEDGVTGIHFAPEGVGFRHFLYQTLLAKLRREGALLAAVSRNDADLATLPFLQGEMVLSLDDFVIVIGSYSAKSAQIKEIARRLNLGLESFVFIDDNPVEVQEVSAAIPELRVIQFPLADDAIPAFFTAVAACFPRATLTEEDVERTAMYRRRLAGMAPVETAGANLTEFLRSLEMSLEVHDRSHGDRSRAIQLINKTNQFNLNGRRVTNEEVEAILAAGGRLFSCTLSDRSGTHGEVMACLVDTEGTIQSFVLSCRVFQRRVEFAFVTWLVAQGCPVHTFAFITTPRNEPIRQFLGGPGFQFRSETEVALDPEEFTRAHRDDLALFALSGAGDPATS